MSTLKVPGLKARTIVLLYACFAGLWIVLSDYVLRFAVRDPVLLQQFEVGKGLAFVAFTCLGLYLLLRLGVAETLSAGENTKNITGKPIFGLILALILLVPAVGFGILRIHSPIHTQQVFSDLSSIAALKAEQIVLWRDGMLAVTSGINDINILSSTMDGTEILPDFASDPEALARLERIRSAYDFAAVMVLDVQGSVLLRSGASVSPTADTLAALTQSSITGASSYSDMFFDESTLARMDFITPIRGPDPDARTLAYLLLRVDPEDMLFPLIGRWPSPSPSAQSLLVRQDGDFVQFLHISDAAPAPPNLRLPRNTNGLVAAMALSTQQMGIQTGVDYQGREVFAAFTMVSDSSWSIITKIDQTEALAPVRQLAAWISIIVFLAVTLITVVLMMLWRQQQRAYEYSLQLGNTERENLLSQFYDLPFIGMAFTSPTSKRWVQFNDHLCEILGYPAEELKRLGWPDITHPDDLEIDVQQFNAVIRGDSEGYRLEKRFIRKNGEIIYAVIDVKCVRKPSGEVDYFVAMVEDITERTLANIALHRQTRYYAALSKMNETIVREKDIAQILQQACQIAEAGCALELVWIGELNPNDLSVMPVAASGKARAYLDAIKVSADPMLPSGQGPGGLALRSGHTSVFNQFQQDTRSSSWHEQARQWNLRAVATCPIIRRNNTWGLISFCANEVDYFTPDLVSLLEKLTADLAFGLDVIEIERASAQAQDQLLLNAKMLESSHEGIFITDAGNRFTMVNKAFMEITGYSADELLGKEPHMLKSGRQDADFYSKLWQQLEQQGCWEGEIWDRRKNGEIFPAWLAITRVPDTQQQTFSHIAIFADITTRKEYENHIEHIAHHDILTDLPNRILLYDRIEMAITHGMRDHHRVSLLFIDLDRFKQINDTLGHEIGDLLLKEVATRITKSLRASDTVSRIGGDEFLVLLPNIKGTDDAAKAAEKIISSISQPYLLQGHKLIITASIGIAIYPENGAHINELMHLSDVAMMEAKQSGRNNYRFFSQDMGVNAANRLELETELRAAISADQFSLVFQPQYTLDEHRLIGIEALLRWHHPRLGDIEPSVFIPIAESSGIIIAIGAWVMNAACQQMSAWRQRLGLQIPISVNVSALQFRQADFLVQVQYALELSALPAACLELEVTESVIMTNAETVLHKLEELARMEVKLAIDDFGTGYSSLSYLRSFPARRLKIDQSFVRDLPTNSDAIAIARSIVSLGESLGMETIAEGVENAAQADFLLSIGCNQGQGYWFSHPLSASELEAKIKPEDSQ